MAAGGPPGRGRDRTRAAERREGGLRTNPVGMIAEDDQQFGRGVGAHTEALTEGRRCLGREAREMLVVYRHLLGESHPAAGERPEGMLGGRGGRVEGARSESGASREQAVIGEVVEGFSQDRRGVHDDLLQRVHRRGARLHRGIPRDLSAGASSRRRRPRSWGWPSTAPEVGGAAICAERPAWDVTRPSDTRCATSCARAPDRDVVAVEDQQALKVATRPPSRQGLGKGW